MFGDGLPPAACAVSCAAATVVAVGDGDLLQEAFCAAPHKAGHQAISKAAKARQGKPVAKPPPPAKPAKPAKPAPPAPPATPSPKASKAPKAQLQACTASAVPARAASKNEPKMTRHNVYSRAYHQARSKALKSGLAVADAKARATKAAHAAVDAWLGS